ncbi:MAG: SpoIID/LytB domain-containing protein [Vicinamibacterales bacterium]
MRGASPSRMLTGGVAAVLALLVMPLAGRQAGEPGDGDLEAASGGRTVRVGTGPDRRVVTVPLEVYVARVLAGEGEPRAAEAAHQALAIAIRTYAFANQNRHQRDGYDLCDTTHCQVMRTASPASRRAAMATAGQTLMYQGRPAELFYSASCGGRTEAASTVWRGMPAYPYLRSVEDGVHGDDAPWTLVLSTTALRTALAKVGLSGESLRSIAVEDRTASGRVTRLRVNGLRPPEISGEDFRAAVGPTVLRSTAFSVRKTDAGYEFSGRGYGHGVGMCVIGAGRLAARGQSASQILELYYPGLQLLTASGVAVPAGVRSALPGAPVGAGDRPASASAPAVPASAAPVVVRVAGDATIDRTALERLSASAYDALSTTLGVSVAPLTVTVHQTVEGFRAATGRPWWADSRVSGSTVDLQSPVLLAQRAGLDFALREAIAGVLVSASLAGRPEWVRVGAARYYARLTAGGGALPPRNEKLVCPADDELLLPVSAAAQREAERRAEACFARARAKVTDWRAVR